MAGNIEYGTAPNGQTISAVNNFVDPYLGVNQSRNLREMGSAYDPKFRAKNDLIQFNIELDISENITFFSQTAYAKDDYWSTQDYNRFVSNPIFSDSSQPFVDWFGNTVASSPWITPGGVYTDPQLGASSRMISADVSSSDNSQFVQEARLCVSVLRDLRRAGGRLGLRPLGHRTEKKYTKRMVEGNDPAPR